MQPHRKRREDALSARKMSKYPAHKAMFGNHVPTLDADGKPVLHSKGKVLRRRVRMADARFADDSPQPLYFGIDHPHAGVFKGMLDAEHGYDRAMLDALRAECPQFERPISFDRATPCCCRRLLFNEPDFAQVPYILEEHCASRGVRVLFLPKFPYELNAIEQRSAGAT